jgi:hypothetical protein
VANELSLELAARQKPAIVILQTAFGCGADGFDKGN